MSIIHTSPMSSRHLLAKASVLIVLIVSILFAEPASAAIRTCRADPIILLSNGEVIQTGATIQTDLKNVRQIEYTIHLPVGVRAIAVIHTSGRLREKEVVKFVNDLPPYHYTTGTRISTAVANVQSVAYTRVLSRSGSAVGISGEHLIIQIKPFLKPLM
jgi:hypothetical protein